MSITLDLTSTLISTLDLRIRRTTMAPFPVDTYFDALYCNVHQSALAFLLSRRRDKNNKRKNSQGQLILSAKIQYFLLHDQFVRNISQHLPVLSSWLFLTLIPARLQAFLYPLLETSGNGTRTKERVYGEFSAISQGQ